MFTIQRESAKKKEKNLSFGNTKLEPGDLVLGERNTLFCNIFQENIHLLFLIFIIEFCHGMFPLLLFLWEERPKNIFLKGGHFQLKAGAHSLFCGMNSLIKYGGD